MEKWIVFPLIIAFLLSLDACREKTIGTVSGIENQYVTIDNVRYVLDADSGYSNANKGKYLGQVSNSKITMRVYSVKGDTEGSYIYTLWDWEGAFYKKEEQ